MTASPREPDAWMYTKEGQEPCFNGHGRRFETYGKEWTEVPLYAAPAPSAEPPATDDPARGLTFAGAIDYWRNIAEKAMAERDAMRECVRELVACADESDSLAAERLYGKPHTPEYKTRELDHRQRSIEAWKAARGER